MRLPSTPEPERRIAKPVDFKPGLKEEAGMLVEWQEAVRGPGDHLNLMSGKRMSDIKATIEPKPVPTTGGKAGPDGKPQATDVPNPDRKDGQWDPLDFMPRFAFAPDEDAFPIDPDFDGDGKLTGNGPETYDGTGKYKDGVIGGTQQLNGAFTVTKKGEFTVLTYSFYYATNKAVHYHDNDYSTAQVYLKPSKDGKLEPAFLYTSWHHGGVLTPWDELAKDQDGRPVIKVHQGSHALQPVGKGEKLPTKGLQIGADGQAVLYGEKLPHHLAFDAFQSNVEGARHLKADSQEAKVRLRTMTWGEAALDPIMPEAFAQADHPVVELGKRALNAGLDATKGLVDKATSSLKGLASSVKGLLP